MSAELFDILNTVFVVAASIFVAWFALKSADRGSGK